MKADSKSGGVLRETIDVIGNYWFGFGSAVALGVFRIVFGTLVFFNFILLSFDWEAWFSQHGYVPSWLGARFLDPRVGLGPGSVYSVPRIDILNGVTNDAISLAVFLATGLAALLTAVGLWTRVSTIALAIGVVSLHHHNAAILHGGDTVVRVMCLYLAIAPSGAACSLDRVIGLLKGRLSAAPAMISMWPQRLIAYNCALLYLTTTWAKWGGHLWQNGTANWYPARLPEFYRFPIPGFMNQFPMVYLTSYGTLAVEFAMGTLVFFKPLRGWVLLSGLLLHGYIEYSMNIPLFSYIVTSLYISFYDGDEVMAWAQRRGSKLKNLHRIVLIPSGQQLKPNAAAFLNAIDPFKLVKYEASDLAQWQAQTVGGEPTPVWASLAKRSPGCWLFGWYPGFWKWFESHSLEPISAPKAESKQSTPLKKSKSHS